MDYRVTFNDSNAKLFEAKDLADLVYYLQTEFIREDLHNYKFNDIVKIEEV